MKNRLSLYAIITSLFLLAVIIADSKSAHAGRKMRLLIYPFQNSGDAAFSWLSAGMTDSITSDMEKISSVQVISVDERRKVLRNILPIIPALPDKKTIKEMGSITGADVILAGSYTVAGTNISITAKLIKVKSGSDIKTVKIDGTLEDIFVLQSKVIISLLDESEKLKSAENDPPVITFDEKNELETGERPSIAAYEFYSKGLTVQDTDPEAALDLFKQAVKTDSSYVDALKAAGYIAGEKLNLFSDALWYLDKADKVLKGREETHTAGYAALMYNIGDVYLRRGNPESALSYFTESRKIQDGLGIGNTPAYAALMAKIGALYDEKADMGNAMEHYSGSRVIMESLGLQKNQAYADLMINIGAVYEIGRAHV